MRRALLALLTLCPLACNKGAAPVGGKTEKSATTVAAKEYTAKNLESDLHNKSGERRKAAITNAQLMDDDGESVVSVLIAGLSDPEADPLGSSTYSRPTSARETAVLAL